MGKQAEAGAEVNRILEHFQEEIMGRKAMVKKSTSSGTSNIWRFQNIHNSQQSSMFSKQPIILSDCWSAE